MGIDSQRAEALAAFFLMKAPGRRLNDLKLMKLMYIAERESLRTLYATLTNDDFVSMPQGPVLSRTYKLLKGEGGVSFPNINYIPRTSGRVSSNTFELEGEVNPEDHFSEAELEVLENVWLAHRGISGLKLADLTHSEFNEWDPAAKEKRTSIPLTIEDIYSKGLGLDDQQAKELAIEVRYYASIQQ